MVNTINPSKLINAIDRFPELKLLIIGDIMMDEYVWGTVTRISQEAPVPVVLVTKETLMLGGAANVVHNIVSLGGKAVLSGVVGTDHMGRTIKSILDGKGLRTDGIFEDKDRPTIVKTRVIAQAQQVVRVDREEKRSITDKHTDDMLAFIKRIAVDLDGIIISDYGKGVITQGLMDGLKELLAGSEMIVAVDPQIDNFELYKGATVITPNVHEAATGAGTAIETEEDLFRAGEMLQEKLELPLALITRGEQGMMLFEENLRHEEIPTMARQVFDVSGAGDTVIAVLTLGLAAGLTPAEAAVLSNFAAGIVVGRVGTATASTDELKEMILNFAEPS